MLLTISTSHASATVLGFLLHKHPDRVRDVSLSLGQARAVFPVANDERCTAALVVDVLQHLFPVRRRRCPGGRS